MTKPESRRLKSSVNGTASVLPFVFFAKYAPTNKFARSSSWVRSMASYAMRLRSTSSIVSSGMSSRLAVATATSNRLSLSNRSPCTASPAWRLRFLSSVQMALSSPVKGLYASVGMPFAIISGSRTPTRLSPCRMCASRKVSGLPGSTVSIHRAVLHNSTASGLRSTPYMQCCTTARRAC